MADLFEKFRNLTSKLLSKHFERLKPNDASMTNATEVPSSASVQRAPYFFQIGFDFGTSFSKCIYRDMMTQRAHIHIPVRSINKELPFLLPSLVIFKDGIISCLTDSDQQYPHNGLYHLKSALVKTALDEWSSSIFDAYRKVTGFTDKKQLYKFIEDCGVFYLGRALGEVMSSISRQFPDFSSDDGDYIAVNMAIPVGEAERPEVNKLFYRILIDAWSLTNSLEGKPSVELSEIEALRDELRLKGGNQGVEEACYVYPEVSANVQGFVRSSLSGAGIYLFSDIGAGTVDQSIFIFHRFNDSETLTYLCGRVLPLGSGQIELRAAQISGNTEVGYLEELRKRKERGDYNESLSKSRQWIEKELVKETEKTLAKAATKLWVREELKRIKLIFGGGGYVEIPYKRAVHTPFSGPLFAQPVSPNIISVPPPPDLELQDHQKRWMKRLSVAYGLSFEKGELARFIYPKDVPEPSHEEIFKPKKEIAYSCDFGHSVLTKADTQS
ncbi:MAG TPA: hypothetical protein PK528_10790 [Syntrophorhabdus sp.]|nr:hypothetical protein [Syntrophorhabdus sp.]